MAYDSSHSPTIPAGKPKFLAVEPAFPVLPTKTRTARTSAAMARVRTALVLRVVARPMPLEKSYPDERRAR